MSTGVDIRVIPFEGKTILYRPLLHRAFFGNHAMAELTRRYAGDHRGRIPSRHTDAFRFLTRIGFLQPDPQPPVSQERSYKPKSAVLLMTNRCNLRCVYCYAAAGEKPPEEMPLALAQQAVDTVAKNAEDAGAASFDITFHGGGEPVQHWEVLKQTILYARNKPLRAHIVLSSNGLWSEKQRSFLLHNLDGLSLSFDGIQQVQNAQRPTAGGGESFTAVMKTIQTMDRMKFPYNIRMTWTAAHASQFAESVRFICEESGCRRIQVEPAFRSGRGGWMNPDPRESDAFISTFKEALDVAGQYNAELMYAGARLWLTICSFCTAAESALVVRPDRKLVACYEITDARHPLADFFTIGHLGAEGPVLNARAIRRLGRMRQERLALCRECFCVWHCAGDCSSRSFSPDGEGHLKFEQRCRINQELSKEILTRYIAQSGGVWLGAVKTQRPGPNAPRSAPQSPCRLRRKANTSVRQTRKPAAP